MRCSAESRKAVADRDRYRISALDDRQPPDPMLMEEPVALRCRDRNPDPSADLSMSAPPTVEVLRLPPTVGPGVARTARAIGHICQRAKSLSRLRDRNRVPPEADSSWWSTSVRRQRRTRLLDAVRRDPLSLRCRGRQPIGDESFGEECPGTVGRPTPRCDGRGSHRPSSVRHRRRTRTDRAAECRCTPVRTQRSRCRHRDPRRSVRRPAARRSGRSSHRCAAGAHPTTPERSPVARGRPRRRRTRSTSACRCARPTRRARRATGRRRPRTGRRPPRTEGSVARSRGRTPQRTVNCHVTIVRPRGSPATGSYVPGSFAATRSLLFLHAFRV